MAQIRSNIGTTLNKKRKMSFLKKLGIYFIFILFFVSLGIWGLTTDKVQIKEVKISGNSSVSSENLSKIIQNELNTYYLWIIPTNNILLLRRGEIRGQILNGFKKIKSVGVYLNGLDKIEVAVVERESNSLWCDGGPETTKKCYFMDAAGFIYEEAPEFSGDTFPKYFGLITDKDPIGQIYFSNNFKNISALYEMLGKISFIPKNFSAVNEHEYEINLVYAGKIIMNDKKSFESQLVNLQALVDNGYIKTDIDSLKKIKYIDLRFGNKVNFELNK